jgi:hypothetical protein
LRWIQTFGNDPGKARYGKWRSQPADGVAAMVALHITGGHFSIPDSTLSSSGHGTTKLVPDAVCRIAGLFFAGYSFD